MVDNTPQETEEPYLPETTDSQSNLDSELTKKSFKTFVKNHKILLSIVGLVTVSAVVVSSLMVKNYLDYQNSLADYETAVAKYTNAAADYQKTVKNLFDTETKYLELNSLGAQLTALDLAGFLDSAPFEALKTVLAEASDSPSDQSQIAKIQKSTFISPVTKEQLTDTESAKSATTNILNEINNLELAIKANTDRTSLLVNETGSVKTAIDNIPSVALPSAEKINLDFAKASNETKAKLTESATTISTAAQSDFIALIQQFLADAQSVKKSHEDVVAAENAKKSKNNLKVNSFLNIDDPAALNVVVNKQRALPNNFVPGPLAKPGGVPNPKGQVIRADAANALSDLYYDMHNEGLDLIIVSGYRSYATQKSTYNRKVKQYGKKTADTVSAQPGHSEHQTGLAVDVNDYGAVLSNNYGETASGKWISANAYKYGFIIRYQAGQQHVVGFTFEPWHLRYIGVKIATDMHNKGIVNLEDYYALPAAPDY